jgi:hypothetical protein
MAWLLIIGSVPVGVFASCSSTRCTLFAAGRRHLPHINGLILIAGERLAAALSSRPRPG